MHDLVQNPKKHWLSLGRDVAPRGRRLMRSALLGKRGLHLAAHLRGHTREDHVHYLLRLLQALLGKEEHG